MQAAVVSAGLRQDRSFAPYEAGGLEGRVTALLEARAATAACGPEMDRLHGPTMNPVVVNGAAAGTVSRTAEALRGKLSFKAPTPRGDGSTMIFGGAPGAKTPPAAQTSPAASREGRVILRFAEVLNGKWPLTSQQTDDVSYTYSQARLRVRKERVEGERRKDKSSFLSYTLG